MLDDATATVTAEPEAPSTPAAPSVAASAAQPASPATPAEPDAALSKRDARRGIEDLVAKHGAPPKEEPPAAVAGKETATAAAGTAGESPKPGDAALSTEPVQPAAPAAEAPKTITVPIDASHPIRASGIDKFEVSTPEQERALRGLLNGTHVRVQQLTEMTTRALKAETRVVELESRDAATEKWTSDPKYQEYVRQYEEIKETHGEEPARRFWAGVQAEYEAIAKKEYDGRMGKLTAEETQRNGEAFKAEAWRRANQLPPAAVQVQGFEKMFNEELDTFDVKLERGHYDGVLKPGDSEAVHKEFIRLLMARLSREPSVQAVFSRAKEQTEQAQKAAADRVAAEKATIERVKREAVEEHMKSLATKRAGNPLNPIGNLPPANRERTTGDDGQVTPAETSPHMTRRAARMGAMEDARRHAGG